MLAIARVQASVDPKTKRTLERVAERNKVSVSALLRILATRLEKGEIRL